MLPEPVKYGSIVSISSSGNMITVNDVTSSINNCSTSLYVFNTSNEQWVKKGETINVSEEYTADILVSLNDTEDVMSINYYSKTFVYNWDISSNDWVQKGDTIFNKQGNKFLRAVTLSNDGNEVMIGKADALDTTVMKTFHIEKYLFNNENNKNIWVLQSNVISGVENLDTLKNYTRIRRRIF
jgi:hypothetical protein